MTETADLHAKLMAHARDYDPSAHHRGLLAPYREVLLIWRAKFMSYEQIAAALTQHGLKVSAAGVGVFCRRTFSRAEIERARREHLSSAGKSVLPSTVPPGRRPAEIPERRGPKVARDNF